VIYFTADQHFGHLNILNHSRRPYRTVDQMDETLIRNWNNLVKADDVVWVLGDFCWRTSQTDSYLGRLTGQKNLIIGNHDDERTTAAKGWQSATHYREIKLHGKHLILFHYPMRDWNGRFYDSMHLYGHVHGEMADFGYSCDVGVDSCNYKPVSFADVCKRLKVKLNSQG
jgi:calcineurin-like phosphoesterase family protein